MYGVEVDLSQSIVYRSVVTVHTSWYVYLILLRTLFCVVIRCTRLGYIIKESDQVP